MTTPSYGFLRDRSDPKKVQMKSENSNRSQRFKNYPRPVLANLVPLTPETQADITRKFTGMVEILLTYQIKLSRSAAEARVRAVLHTTYANLGFHEGEEEGPVEEMFRFNEAEDVKVVARMVEEEKQKEREREEEMRREAEREKEQEWVLVEKKKKNKKEVGPALGVVRGGVVGRGNGRGGPIVGVVRGGALGGVVLAVVRNAATGGGLKGRGSFESMGGRGRGFGGRGRGAMQ